MTDSPGEWCVYITRLLKDHKLRVKSAHLAKVALKLLVVDQFIKTRICAISKQLKYRILFYLDRNVSKSEMCP